MCCFDARSTMRYTQGDLPLKTRCSDTGLLREILILL